MNVQQILSLIEIGSELAAGVVPGAAPTAGEIATFANLLQQQVSVFEQWSGKSMADVLAQITYENPDPTSTDQTDPNPIPPAPAPPAA